MQNFLQAFQLKDTFIYNINDLTGISPVPSTRFKTLFHLTNNDMDIVEIKHLGLPEETDKSLLFYWLLIRRGNLPERLEFASMSTDGGNQVRVFEEGKLSFNGNAGHYITKDEKTSQTLVVSKPPKLNTHLIQLIEHYLP